MTAARKTDGNPLAASLRQPSNENLANFGTASPLTVDTLLDTTFVYVRHGAAPDPVNQNDSASRYVYVEPDKTCADQDKTSGHVLSGKPALTVFCGLPSPLPVLPQEVALIRAYLPALLDLIAANDNDDSHV